MSIILEMSNSSPKPTAPIPPSASSSSNSIDSDQNTVVDSSPVPPLHECFRVKVNRILKEKLGTVKEVITLVILLALLFGLMYNYFMRDERDLPESFFQNLYKLLASSSGLPITNQPIEGQNIEWAKVFKNLNFTKN